MRATSFSSPRPRILIVVTSDELHNAAVKKVVPIVEADQREFAEKFVR